MLSQNPEPKLKYSKNLIVVTSHFGTLLIVRGDLKELPEALICSTQEQA